MADLKRILNKKGWTGKELGQIQLLDLATCYSNFLSGKHFNQYIIEPEQFNNMLHSVTDTTQLSIYRNYIDIHSWIRTSFPIISGNCESAKLCFKTLIAEITSIDESEKVFMYAGKQPVIMTQKQYDEEKAKSLEEMFTEEDGTETPVDMFLLLNNAIIHYEKLLSTAPDQENPLREISKLYKTQAVTSEVIKRSYNNLAEYGYYTLPDGSRTDKISVKEAVELTKTDLAKDLDKVLPNIKTALDNDEITDDFRVTIEYAKRIMNGETEDSIYYKAVPFTPYDHLPDGLTKWDIIKDNRVLDFYPANLDGSGDAYTDDNYLASAQDFMDCFGDLAKAILEDIDSKYTFANGKKLADIPLQEWEYPGITLRELYTMDFYGEKAYLDNDKVLFSDNPIIEKNGIAIIHTANSAAVDENGYYIQPKTESKIAEYFQESEEYADKIANLEKTKKRLLSYYYYIRGFNTQIDLIIDFTGVQELSCFKVDLTNLEKQIQYYNWLIPLLGFNIYNTTYADYELKKHKLDTIKEVFTEIDLASLAIPEENITKAKELIANYSAFTSNHTLFDDLLCNMPQEEKGEAE